MKGPVFPADLYKSSDTVSSTVIKFGMATHVGESVCNGSSMPPVQRAQHAPFLGYSILTLTSFVAEPPNAAW